MVYVQSTALKALSYDAKARSLRATFRESGRTYVYRDVPQHVYDELIFAESLGSYFNSHIRDAYAFDEVSS